MKQPENAELMQAHGLTVGQMKTIALKQSGQIPGGLKQYTPNNVHNLKDKHFIADGLDQITVDEHEVGIYHVAQETRSFNPASGEKLSKGMVQKYAPHDFIFMRDNGGFTGQSVFILHDPSLPTPEFDADQVEPVKMDVVNDAELAELRHVAEEMEIDLSENETIETLRAKIAQEALDFAKRSVEVMNSLATERNEAREKARVAEEAAAEALKVKDSTPPTQTEPEPRYVHDLIKEEFTAKQLKGLASAYGIEHNANDTREAMVTKIIMAKIVVG